MNRYLAHLALFTVTLIYGANYTIAKELLDGDYITPLGLVLFRISTSIILFFIVHSLFIKERIEKQDLFRLMLCGIFGVFLNQSLFITGLKFTTPINASVLMVTTPIFVLTISILMKQEKLTLLKIMGLILGASGTLIIILSKGQLDLQGTFKGNLFILLNAMSYGLYLVLVKPLMKKYNPFTVIKWIFLFGLIPIIPIGFEGASEVNWDTFTLPVWIAFFYVLIMTTFFAYLLNASALKSVKPSTVGVYIYLQPFLATIVALVMGRDHLTVSKVLAGVIIILGVYLVSINKASILKTKSI